MLKMALKKRSIYFIVITISTMIIGTSIGLGLYFNYNKEVQLMIVIHCEPGNFNLTTDYPEQYWEDLKDMVIQATIFDVKLTLMFNPQWGTYILQNISRLNMIRDWEANGHEIAVHHHGPDHGSWNGYTDVPGYSSHQKYIGTISDMMNILNQLPISGKILSGCISTENNSIYDFPQEMTFGTYGGSEKTSHLWSNPERITLNEHLVTRVTHARYDNIGSEVNIDFEEFKELYKSKNKYRVMGLVWHVFNYADSDTAFNQLFQYLNQQGIVTWTVQEILSN